VNPFTNPRFSRVAVLLGVLALTGGQSVAAQDPPRRPPQDRAEMEQRVRAQMQRVVKERLQLTDEESEELGAVVRSFEERRRALRRSEMATRRRVEALTLEGGADEEEAAQLLARMVELRRQEAELFADEQAALLEVLSAAKVLELQAVREEMGRRIRNLRRGGDRGRPPGGNDRPGNVDWILGVDLSS
jgi:Spy/CpxP family protein refolding chaperone